jgi:hypothetical protein
LTPIANRLGCRGGSVVQWFSALSFVVEEHGGLNPGAWAREGTNYLFSNHVRIFERINPFVDLDLDFRGLSCTFNELVNHH